MTESKIKELNSILLFLKYARKKYKELKILKFK